MALKYESVVPWGRSFEEYVDMFDLKKSDLEKRILGCGDGPASFNCTMKQKNGEVVSIDPIYQFSKADIEKRIDETYHTVMEQTRENADKFIWTKIKDVEELGNIRMKAMRDFVSDYDNGKDENRYIYAELPHLPFEDNQFDLSLASHFLFLYTDNLSLEFHLQSITEMLRVASEVRIFPLLDLNSKKSPYVDVVMGKFSEMGYCVEEIKVDYEFQNGGNTMLRIAKQK